MLLEDFASEQDREPQSLSEEYQRMTAAYDIHTQNRQRIDAAFAALLHKVVGISKLAGNLPSSTSAFSSLSPSEMYVVARPQSEVLAVLKLKDEIAMLEAQLKEADNLAAAKAEKIARARRQLLDGGSTSQRGPLDQDALSNIAALADSSNELERRIRELENAIIYMTVSTQMLRYQVEKEEKDEASRQVLAEQKELVSQQVRTSEAALRVVDEKIKRLSEMAEEAARKRENRVQQKEHQRQVRELQRQSRREQAELERERRHKTSEQVVALLAAEKDNALKEVETLEREIELMQQEQKAFEEGEESSGRGRSSSPKITVAPASPLAAAMEASKRMEREYSPRMSDQVRETMLLLKAFLFNLCDDIDWITELITAVLQEENRVKNQQQQQQQQTAGAPSWRQFRLTEAFVDAVVVMEQDYAQDPAVAKELLLRLKTLVVLHDLFLSSSDEGGSNNDGQGGGGGVGSFVNLDTLLEQATVRQDAVRMFQAAKIASATVDEDRRKRYYANKRKQRAMLLY